LPVLPLALSDTGWTAVGAVGGALVGAMAGALVTGYFNWRRDRALMRAGARLVSGDLSMAAGQMASAKAEAKWIAYATWHDNNWIDYRGLLAQKLSAEDFEKVSQAARVVKEIYAGMINAPTWPEGQGWMPLPQKSVKALDAPIDECIDAFNRLTKISKHDRISRADVEPKLVIGVEVEAKPDQ
jgi:hypothetical protein